ncbi:hypothetical protein ACFQ0M_03175 [Kitasatospora aburaviensis]
MASTPDLDRIADELYTLAPGEFTSARNGHADRLRKADPQIAKQVRALRRPTLAAWAANLLVHHHGDLVEQLLELGQALRDAQEHLAGEQLRALTDQRRQLVRALTEQAREAARAGHPLGAEAVTDLERTLSAALADPNAARALAQGRLTAPLEPVLWPGAAVGEPEGEAADTPPERRGAEGGRPHRPVRESSRGPGRSDGASRLGRTSGHWSRPARTWPGRSRPYARRPTAAMRPGAPWAPPNRPGSRPRRGRIGPGQRSPPRRKVTRVHERTSRGPRSRYGPPGRRSVRPTARRPEHGRPPRTRPSGCGSWGPASWGPAGRGPASTGARRSELRGAHL